MTVDKALLQELVVVNADYDIWSGQVRLEDKDIKLGEGGELPPDRVAQLGNKTICDPASLKVFRSLRGATRRMLESYGLPFLTGWAVPRTKLSEILGKLETARITFEQEKQAFLDNYDGSIQNWIANNVGYEEAIRNGVLDRNSVEKRLDFNYQVFHIQPVSGEPNAEKRLADQTKGLVGQLFREIETEADDFYQKYLRGKAEISIRTRKRLECLADKVDGLSFLNSAFEPVVRLLRETVDGYDQHADGGPIGAPFFFQIHSVVTILCDQAKMKDFADGNIAAQPNDDAFDFDVSLPVSTGHAASHSVDPDAKPALSAQQPQGHSKTPPAAQASAASVQPARQIAQPVQQTFDLDELFHDMDSFLDEAASQPVASAPAETTLVSPTVAPQPVTQAQPSNAPAFEMFEPEDSYYL
jgi:hypothetical protein